MSHTHGHQFLYRPFRGLRQVMISGQGGVVGGRFVELYMMFSSVGYIIIGLMHLA